ncbi:hypothetical protein N7539_005739 [Penicillium diatomitis]|uniref:Uncharacterized protein n=1 Tax=Penicillium diatomitis TaxID=2819901 RepID=A0A9W9X582_9EURO|nr:uncharacterized protein N7539_005739 [Penicillium diatomitis]KAJ5483943.1 hypothetical protein N7539_005739 [Penicillium diatomitis]
MDHGNHNDTNAIQVAAVSSGGGAQSMSRQLLIAKGDGERRGLEVRKKLEEEREDTNTRDRENRIVHSDDRDITQLEMWYQVMAHKWRKEDLLFVPFRRE